MLADDTDVSAPEAVSRAETLTEEVSCDTVTRCAPSGVTASASLRSTIGPRPWERSVPSTTSRANTCTRWPGA